MATVRTLNVGLKANITDFQRKMGQAQTHLKGFTAQIENMRKRMDRMFGEGSLIGAVGKGLAGAGVLAAVGLIADQVKRAAEESAGLVDQFRQGQVNARELAGSLALNIPVVSKIRDAAEAVFHAIDGGVKRAEALTAGFGKAMTAAEQLQSVRDEIDVLKAPAAARPAMQLQAELASRLRAIQRLQSEATTGVEQSALTRLADRTRELFKLKLAELPSPFESMFAKIKAGFAAAFEKVREASRKAAEELRADWARWEAGIEGVAARIRDQLMTPMQRFSRDLATARQAFARGLLTEGQLDQWTARLREELAKATAVPAVSAISPVSSTFREISLRRTFIPGVSGVASSAGRGRPQKVTDESVKAAIDSMKKDIVRALAGGVTATA